MAQKPLTNAQCDEVLNALQATSGNHDQAARLLGMPRNTFRGRIIEAKRRHRRPKGADTDLYRRVAELTELVNELEEHNRKLSRDLLSVDKVKEIIHGTKRRFDPPAWTAKPMRKNNTGVPTLFLSDLHWDEVVMPAQVNHVNAYNREIAERRLKHCFTATVDLLMNHMARPRYDYCVVALGGDMLSGNIHEELKETNEYPILMSLMNCATNLIAGMELLLTVFPRLFVPAVVGNHGRLTRKPVFKNRAYDNYDWLLYQIIARHFAKDDRISFAIADSSDVLYNVYGTRYLLTHGDQFQGGTGISGPFTPWMLGDARKRKRQVAIKDPYDVMLMGHWHMYSPLKTLIVNGSLKGYDEYAYGRNFDFEPPTQAMWLDHADVGRTAMWPIYLEKRGAVFQ